MKKCSLIEFAAIVDSRGSLLPVEGESKIPFKIKRVFFIYNTDGSVERGGHANRNTKFVLMAISGKVDVQVKINDQFETYTLSDPTKGLFIDNMVWKTMSNFSKNAILVAFCSHKFDPTEYI